MPQQMYIITRSTDWFWRKNTGVLRWRWFVSAIREPGNHGKSHLHCNCFWALDSRVWCFVDANALGLGRVVLGTRGRGMAMWARIIWVAHAWLQNLSFALFGTWWLCISALLQHSLYNNFRSESQNSLPSLIQHMAPYTFYHYSWRSIEQIFQGQGSKSSGHRRLNDVDANPTFHSCHPSLFINLGEKPQAWMGGSGGLPWAAYLLASNQPSLISFLYFSLISKRLVCLESTTSHDRAQKHTFLTSPSDTK